MQSTVSAPPFMGGSGDFGARTIEFVCETLQADWGCFYLLDANAEPNTFSPHGIPEALYLGYIDRNMRNCDPLHPGYLKPEDRRRFTLLNDPSLNFPAERTSRYWKFLNSFGVRQAGEMVFRHQGRPIAGLNLLWRRRSAQPDSIGFGMPVHSYVEFNVSSRFRPERVPHGAARLDLTQREREVVRLACAGCTNADIAGRLNIGLATVKTHLVNIFSKAGVSNRTALVNRMLAEGSSAGYL